MLRLHRHRNQAKSGEKLDFRFSFVKALQVPKGWEKLVVSIVSAETGKTVTKTGKAVVRNASCQWTETLSVECSVKEAEDSLFKFVVSMGSARSGILGEATLNLSEYMSKSDTLPLSLSLKKCTHGTTLQVKIQCMTPRVKSMDEDSKERDLDKSNGNHKDLEKSLTFSSTNDFGLNSNPGELGSRDTSFSLSESHQSYDSAEGSIASEDVSIRADSLSSETREIMGVHRAEIFHSKQSSFNSQISENSRQESSVKAFREASEGTLEELRIEAKMWERNARKLMLDLDAACEERDGLKIEVEKLKQTSAEVLNGDDSNSDIAIQLKRSHESNVELVSVLQDLEETVERQKIEISELLGCQSNLVDVEKSLEVMKARFQESQDSEKDLSVKLKTLERVLEEKNEQIEKGKILNGQAFLDIETEYKTKLLEKEGEIEELRTKLSDSSTVNSGGDESLNGIIEELKEKVQELERDCTELTEENLDLLFKLKEAKNDPIGMSTSVDFPARTSFDFQLSERNLPTSFGEDIDERDDLISMRESKSLSVEFEAKIEILEMNLRSKEEEISMFRRTVSDLQKEKAQLQEQLEIVLQESDINFKCLNDLQNDLAVLTSSIDSHSSVNKVLERKSSELETGNRELELHISELERENAQFSDLVASLEAQLEAVRSEFKNSKSRFETLIVECDSLRRSNEELSNQKLELSDRCSFLEKEFEKSRKGFTDCSKKVEDLELDLCSALSEFTSKEKILMLQINALAEENARHKEKFEKEESLLNEMYMEKVAEEQKLGQQVKHLVKKLSETEMEKERVVFDSMEELLRLRADNERLEADFGEAQSKIKQIEIEFNDMEMLYEEKLKTLSSDFAASNEDLEKLSKSLENYKASEAKFEDEIGKIKSEREKLELLVLELEDHKSEKLALQEKVCKMEDELVEIEILRIRDSEMMKELSKIRDENRQYEQKIEQLQALEEEKQNSRELQPGNRKVSNFSRVNTKVNPKDETAKSTNLRRDNRRSQHQREKGGGSESPDASPRNNGDRVSKIHSLEDQLAKALEENIKYKAQLSKLSLEGRKGNADSPPEAKLVSKAKYERTKSTLESELRDIRERYLTMSLRYAEVEAQREELVMKLKNVNTPKRWFG